MISTMNSLAEQTLTILIYYVKNLEMNIIVKQITLIY